MMTKAMHAWEKHLLGELVLLKKIGDEMARVNLRTYPEPALKIESGDILLGLAPEDIRRLWVVIDEAADELGEAVNHMVHGELTMNDGRVAKRIHDEHMGMLPHLHDAIKASIHEEFAPEKRSGIKEGTYLIIFTADWKVYLRRVDLANMTGINVTISADGVKIRKNRPTGPV